MKKLLWCLGALTMAPMLFAQDESQNRLDRWLNEEAQRDYDRRGLWYGTPGVRAGDDMLRPTIELFRRPSGLLDFRPRPIPPATDDRIDRDTTDY